MEELFKKSGKTIINVRNYRTLFTEVFKTLNNITPSFMTKISRLLIANRQTQEKYKEGFEGSSSFRLLLNLKNQIKFMYLEAVFRRCSVIKVFSEIS